MKKLILSVILAITTQSVIAQTYNNDYAEVTNLVSQQNITNSLQEFQNLGIKTTGSTQNANALTWLKNKYIAFGYKDSEIKELPFNYQGKTSKNLEITKIGTKYPNTFVIICGHYDTIYGPGTNDNGSGIAVILEVARILKNIPTEYSVKFINFSGEEQGLIGSSNYVNQIVNGTNPKMDIKLVFNIDEVGGVAGQINNKITCERDTNNSPSGNNSGSNLITQELMKYVEFYSTLTPNLSYAYASDYMPFQANGEIITGFFEYNESSHPHSSTDVLANMDPTYVYNVTKAATGAMQHFAIADKYLATNEANKHDNHFTISPNPAKDFININLKTKDQFQFTISDLSGKTLITSNNAISIDISSLSKGLYVGTLKIKDQSYSKKFIIK